MNLDAWNELLKTLPTALRDAADVLEMPDRSDIHLRLVEASLLAGADTINRVRNAG